VHACLFSWDDGKKLIDTASVKLANRDFRAASERQHDVAERLRQCVRDCEHGWQIAQAF
jgi:hypothetical protein